MLKTAWFLRFRERQDLAEARERWADAEAQLMLQVPGVVRYVQNLAAGSEETPSFDGFATVWWSDRSAYARALKSPEWSKIARDARDLFDTEWMRGRSAELDERVMRVAMGAKPDGVSTPPPGPIKLVGLLRYLPGLRRDEASEYWLRQHGDIALTISQIGHYVQNHAARPLRGNEGAPLAFDGYSEAWFEDMGALERGMASQEWQNLSADGPNLFDSTAFMSATVEERLLRG